MYVSCCYCPKTAYDVKNYFMSLLFILTSTNLLVTMLFSLHILLVTQWEIVHRKDIESISAASLPYRHPRALVRTASVQSVHRYQLQPAMPRRHAGRPILRSRSVPEHFPLSDRSRSVLGRHSAVSACRSDAVTPTRHRSAFCFSAVVSRSDHDVRFQWRE